MTLVYIAMGVLAALVVFLYVLLPMLRRGGQKSARRKKKQVKTYELPEIVIGKCPVCGNSLTAKDRLYTKTYKAEPKDKIYVRGCSKCLKKDPGVN
jgi:hypothetical protein